MSLTSSFTGTDMVADIIRNGGGTYGIQRGADPIPESLHTGYMVSKAGRENVYFADNFAEYGAQYISQFIVDNYDCIYSSGFFLGAWVDNGLVYLDVSVFYSSYEAALDAAVANNQIAFYDNAAGEAVYLNTEDN